MDSTLPSESHGADSTYPIPGSTISHYRILERLGRGGMGVVYKAEDLRLGRFVALKFLSVALTQDSNALERLRREARAASSLSHPHICALHDIGEFQNQPFLVMEFLEGETLNAKIDGRPLELQEILKIARQVSDALQASHEKRIIHRDIKPSNVMITSRGEAKVLDFGLAKMNGSTSPDSMTGMTEEGALLGTVSYMSPEQALGHPIDHRSDLFSLGVMLYEMATGRLPFSGSTAMATLNQIINAEPEAVTRLNVNIPPGLERIISRCLEKNAESRFQSARDLWNDLGKAEPDTQHVNPRRARHNLPRQLGRFIGRKSEVAEINRLLDESRLLTLTGSGGIGKTRLALEAATAALATFDDGVWFVEFAVLLDEALVPQTVASTFGLRDEQNRSITNTLVDYLKHRKLLLVLDNCEHLVGACAQLSDTILRASAGVRILATSRQPLGITGETVFRVPSLEEAVELFVERARSVKPTLELTAQNHLVTAKLCDRLEGIPLAIELAASRVKVMSIEQIEARLGDRLGLLTGGSRTALPRHQTLRAAIDWSYNLLPETEQILFRRLSLFSGGWTLEAAETVCAGEEIQKSAVLELLSGLIDKSLVLAEDRDGHNRYRFMATLHEYAQERLSQTTEAETLLLRRATYYVALSEEAEAQLIGSDQKIWLNLLSREHDNLRSVLAWASTMAPELGVRLAASLARFWNLRGYFNESRGWLADLLKRAGSQTERKLRAKALNALGNFTWMQGDYAAGRSYCEEALSLFRELGDKCGAAGALSNLGNVARLLGDSSTEVACHTETLALSRESGDKRGIAVALNNLGIAAEQAGDYAGAWTLHEESLAIREEMGDKRGAAVSLNNMGNIALMRSDYVAARSWLEKSLALRRELGDKQGIALSLNNLAEVVRKQGHYAEARCLLEEGLALRRELGDKSGIALTLNNLGEFAWRHGDYASAMSLGKESVAILREVGHKYGLASALCTLGDAVRRQRDFEVADTLYKESASLFRELGDRHGTATALNCLGQSAERQGRYVEADALFKESLTMFRDLGASAEALTALDNLASLALARGESDRAGRLLGASQALRGSLVLPRLAEEEGEYTRIHSELSRLAPDAFTANWNAGHTMTLDQAIAFALTV